MFLSESRLLLSLAMPLIISGIIETSIGFFSNIFLAHLGAEKLAAGALVNWVFATLMVIIWGTLSAITTLVARYYGIKNYKKIGCMFYAGLLLALVLIGPAMLLLWNLAPIFLFFGQKASVVVLAQPYLHGLTWVIIPDFIITVLLQFLSGLGRTKANLAFSLLVVPINLFLNYSFMFGRFGFPHLGIAGIGWGTAVSFWIVTIGYTIYFGFNRNYRIYLTFPDINRLFSAIKEILQVGFPLGLMYFVEIAFFLGMSILMGRVSLDTLSANQIALQFFWLFSIVTFALASGITIRVGHSLGKHDQRAVHYTTYLGVFYATAFMLFVTIFYCGFPEKLISIDFNLKNVKNIVIIKLAKEFLVWAALVQLIEAPRFAFFGALRGLKETKFTLWVSILIFWVIALPLGYVANLYGFSAHAFWGATLFGEVIGTCFLVYRYHDTMKKYFRQKRPYLRRPLL